MAAPTPDFPGFPGLPHLAGRIVDATIVRQPVALRRPLGGAKGNFASRAVRLLHLVADDGVEGIGEGSSVDWLAATAPPVVASTFRVLVDRIRNGGLSEADLLEWSVESDGPSAVRSCVQTALLDLEARRRGSSLAALLGATDPCLPMPVSALVGDDEPAAMAREASSLVRRGFDCFKVKVGRAELAADLGRVAAVRTVVGTGASLRVDANGAWSVDEAARALDRLAASHVTFVEEPLREAARVGELEGPVRIALDESVCVVRDLEEAIARGGFQVLVLKLERVGGPLAALSMAALAMSSGLEVVFTDSIESSVGRAATAHVAAAAYERAAITPLPVGLGGLFVLEDGGDVEPEMLVAGPGLGIDVDSVAAGRR